MTDTFPLVLLILFKVISAGSQTAPWVLNRADPGSSSVSFFNNTVTDSYMMVRWTWRDSASGFWDTRLRVTLNKEDITGGGFSYSDQYENELASVRWFRTKMDGPIKWKYTAFSSPPDSWWMTSVVPNGNITWGFKNQIIDGSWVFRVGNDTLEPKNHQNVDGWSQGTGNRWKRSLKSYENGIDNPQTKQEHFIKIKRSPSEEDYDDDEEEDIFQKIIGCFMEFFKALEGIFQNSG
ncbi:uncharacterized protein LOC100169242 [Acyrthosiphon pisum]|uniref:Uncharacterized protein n=1 Tax=Acyrthosiphon pisum TaxID=7029 RepID=A0A8R2B4P3_ACYPI|nr:uncharacterized protein LOC100169242 [Acyrthosiphon pisum]|eukprot:XP_008181561.1 PREDICTED: uncharacterized protein LOC100169242 [Acyrthosiphon pisum]